MRVSEGRGHLWTMPSGSILEQAKLGQLKMENLPSPKLGEGAQRAGEVCYPVDRQPTTVNRRHTPPPLCGTSPTLGEEFTLSALPALSALKQTSLVLRTISPNLGENDFSSPVVVEE